MEQVAHSTMRSHLTALDRARVPDKKARGKRSI
jgi:hypothetical protein